MKRGEKKGGREYLKTTEMRNMANVKISKSRKHNSVEVRNKLTEDYVTVHFTGGTVFITHYGQMDVDMSWDIRDNTATMSPYGRVDIDESGIPGEELLACEKARNRLIKTILSQPRNGKTLGLIQKAEELFTAPQANSKGVQ